MLDGKIRRGVPIALPMLALALLLGACSGGAIYHNDSILWHGNEIIEVQVDRARTEAETAERVVQVLERQQYTIDWFDRGAGVLQTEGQVVGDSMAVRLHVVMVDSSLVEVAGAYQTLRGARPGAWQRIKFNHDASPRNSIAPSSPASTVAWVGMLRAAEALGSVASYKDGAVFGTEGCGVRTCGEHTVCKNQVCVCEEGHTGEPYQNCKPIEEENDTES